MKSNETQPNTGSTTKAGSNESSRLQLRLSTSSSGANSNKKAPSARASVTGSGDVTANNVRTTQSAGGTGRNTTNKMPRYETATKKTAVLKEHSAITVQAVQTHHQTSSLHFTYLNSQWYVEGVTALYLTLLEPAQDDSKNQQKQKQRASTGKMNDNDMKDIRKQISLHLRGGQDMKILQTQIFQPKPSAHAASAPESTTTGTSSPSKTDSQHHDKKKCKSFKMQPLPNVQIKQHHDSLSKVLTKPCSTFTPEHYLQIAMPSKQRYEADTQCTRGGSGMMDALRCQSIASNAGEVRIGWVATAPTAATTTDRKNATNTELNDIVDCWKNDLMSGLEKHEMGGDLGRNLRKKCWARNSGRRMERLDLLSKRLAGDVRDGTNQSNGTPIKVVIRFRIGPIDRGSVHLGGIHFQSPCGENSQFVNMSSSTPHVYTTSGMFGDHQGPRSWIPTIDSAYAKHRCSHEIMVKVTSDWREGLWASGCGENFGVSGAILHPVPCLGEESKPDLLPENDNGMDVVDSNGKVPSEKEVMMKELRNEMGDILGRGAVDFTSESFHFDEICKKKEASKKNDDADGVEEGSNENELHVHIIPPESSIQKVEGRHIYPELATSMWTSCIWDPCPSRSLGLAIGPWKVLYDQEYYSPEPEEEEDDDESQKDDDDDDDDEVPTINESALKNGEGIRQLYFAPSQDRCRIHAHAKVIGPSECQDDVLMEYRSKKISADMRRKIKEVELSIIGSTTGVPNRALSLMRDILSLPSYRTSSYTQIWIPHAVNGGATSGTLNSCPEISCNPFIGGAILDSTLLAPPGHRLPYHSGGRTLQFLQALCAIRGWIVSALPIGSGDEIGDGYIHSIFESLTMSLYERAHGAFGEGGGRQSFFFSKRYAKGSGLNSRNMDFLPVKNVEEEDVSFAIHGGGPDEEKSKEELYRNASNGTESHTSSLDEFSVRQLLLKDVLEGIERVRTLTQDKIVRNEKVKVGISAPLPSGGWQGSRVCATFLSSNSASSSLLGCGAVELVHPVGGNVYRTLKCHSIRRIIEGRAGIEDFVRVMRAAFIAGIMHDKGLKQVHLPEETKDDNDNLDENMEELRPKFVACVDEIIQTEGLTHDVFTRSLREISGNNPQFGGTSTDVSRGIEESPKLDTATKKRFLEPEYFPNSFVRGSSGLYLRVGTHVAAVSGDQQQASEKKHLQIYAEPVIPQGGIAFGGHITLRVIENEGHLREFNNLEINSNGSRSDWGPILLHAKPVTDKDQQQTASGAIESRASGGGKKDSSRGNSVFNENELHSDGYQALELVRITNGSPLLWVRVDPHCQYNGRISIFQPDACLGEQLFHDGDAASQVEALRGLAERPLTLQAGAKIEFVYGAPVKQLPVRLLADCLRGSVALHADLPHNPAIRSQAALAIAQWQNKEAPQSKDTGGSDAWVGLNLLMQYYNERFATKDSFRPMRHCRVCLKKGKDQAAAQSTGTTSSGEYEYLDSFVKESDRKIVVEGASEVENEEDEEHRVRSAALIAIACCRAKDGLSPPSVLKFFEKVLGSGDEISASSNVSFEEAKQIRDKRLRKQKNDDQVDESDMIEDENFLNEDINDLPYISSTLIADSLLALCYINVRPAIIENPDTGALSQSKAPHPCLPLLNLCCRWLEWALYKEDIRMEAETQLLAGIGGNTYQSIPACAITALYSLALLRQSTTEESKEVKQNTIHASDRAQKRKSFDGTDALERATNTQYYVDIFDSVPVRGDSTRAAAAQAILSLCCAADRAKDFTSALGLLTGLEFALDRIIDKDTSPDLKQTLAALMFDACTGKISSCQRSAIFAGRNDLLTCGAKLLNGPLGGSYGNDNGTYAMTAISSATTMPVAKAVNDGAHQGLKLLKRAGLNDKLSQKSMVRVARFASLLWRTINGEMGGKASNDDISFSSDMKVPITSSVDGVCAHDGHLRCSLLTLWQWIWPKECPAVQKVQNFKKLEETQPQWYKDIGAQDVMEISAQEREAAQVQDNLHNLCEDLRRVVNQEIDRQDWRGEMARVSHDYATKFEKTKESVGTTQGLNQPLSTIDRDPVWEHGGWIASAASQRRKKEEDGGGKVRVRAFV